MIVSRECLSLAFCQGHILEDGSGEAQQLTAMGARTVGFILYLALSYGVIYFLIGTKRSLGGRSTKEPLTSAAIMAALVLSIAVGTMLVGLLPMVFLAVALVAFIAYILPSVDGTASDRTSLTRMLPSIGSIDWLKRAPALGLGDYGLGCARRPVFIAVRCALAEGVASLAGYLRSRARGFGNRGGDDTRCAKAPTDQEPTPSPIHARVVAGGAGFTEGHRPDAEHATLVPLKQLGRRLTRDEAKRLLECLEAR
jgi:hypothetical protein